MGLSQIWAGVPGIIGDGTTIALASLPGSPEFAFWPYLIKVLIVLSALLGMFLLTAFLWKRGSGLRSGGSSPLIQVLATHYLAPKKTLLLVGVGEERFLLANAGDHLTLITGLASQGEKVPSAPQALTALGPV